MTSGNRKILNFCLVVFFLALLPSWGSARELSSLDSFRGPIKALENKKYFQVLSAKIKEAKKEIKVCAYLFKTSDYPKNLANKILADLAGAAKRGVKVEVILEENDRPDDNLNIQNHQTAKKLKAAGIKVRFDGKQAITHAKLVVIDESLVFIGSHNLSHTALSKSNETSLMVESPELAGYFLEYFRYIETSGE